MAAVTDKLDDKLDYKQNIGMVHSIAKKAYARMLPLNISMEYEDIVQELSIIFFKAAEKFDPNRGAQFSTYYYWAAFNHINQLVNNYAQVQFKSNGKFKRRDPNEPNVALSVEEQIALAKSEDQNISICISSVEDIGGEEFNFEEYFASNSMNPEEIYERKEAWQVIERKLSPLAAMIVEWIRNPPSAYVTEMQKLAAHHEKESAYRRDLGRRSMNKCDFGGLRSMIEFVGKIWGVSKKELARVESELLAAGALV